MVPDKETEMAFEKLTAVMKQFELDEERVIAIVKSRLKQLETSKERRDKNAAITNAMKGDPSLKAQLDALLMKAAQAAKK
jgi:hypothetical protein